MRILTPAQLEAKRVASRLYYALNLEQQRERSRAKMRAKRAANPDYKRDQNREYMRLHRDKYMAMAAEDRAKRPYLYLIRKAKHRAKTLGLAFDLTNEWAESRWTGRCEMTGAKFKDSNGKRTAYSASIDKIDPKKGYTQDNCRFILVAINTFKGNWTDEVVLEISNLIVQAVQ